MDARRSAVFAGICAVLAGCTAGVGVSRGSTDAPLSSRTDVSVLVSSPHCGMAIQPVPMLALTGSGAIDAIDPANLRVTATLANSARPELGIAVRPELDAAYVTARGRDGRDAVWMIPIGDCHSQPAIVETDAELPSVSPDGGYLGFVTLDSGGRQTGAAIVALNAGGSPSGSEKRFGAASTPPPLPITGVAVGRDDASLAVWGGFVDRYLGSKRVTVGTLDPATASSLGALTPVFDAEGVSVPVAPGKANPKPEDWQSSPVYLPNGELLVGDHSTNISLPFTYTTPGIVGGGIRLIVKGVGQVRSLAEGADGSLAYIGSDGRLTVAERAVDLPFGPGASMPPTAGPREHGARGRFTAVAWTEGPGSEYTSLPAVFHTIAHLPSVISLSETTATRLLNGLDLPVFVAKTVPDSSDPVDTVLAQDPAAGTGMECQCSVALTVSG